MCEDPDSTEIAAHYNKICVRFRFEFLTARVGFYYLATKNVLPSFKTAVISNYNMR